MLEKLSINSWFRLCARYGPSFYKTILILLRKRL